MPLSISTGCKSLLDGSVVHEDRTEWSTDFWQQWIFIVEGVLTVIVATTAYFLIPGHMESVKWLSDSEIEIMRYRITHDGDLKVPMDDTFRWQYVRAGLLDWKLYINFAQYITCLAMVCKYF